MPIVTDNKKFGERGLLTGILIVVSVFFLAMFGATRLLLLTGWNPLEGPVYFYGGVAVVFLIATFAVYGLFHWARKV